MPYPMKPKKKEKEMTIGEMTRAALKEFREAVLKLLTFPDFATIPSLS